MTGNLLPCPFCGETGDLHDEIPGLHPIWFVLCRGCGASTALHIECGGDAVTSWNRRTPLTTLRMHQIKRALREEVLACEACVVKLDEALERLKAGERLEALPCDTEQEEWR